LTDIGPTRWEKGRLPIFGIIKNSPLAPTQPAINKPKLPSARGEMGGLPENAVLHPPHGVQFATHAKLKVDDYLSQWRTPEEAETP
jgi:hypothetical protein